MWGGRAIITISAVGSDRGVVGRMHAGRWGGEAGFKGLLFGQRGAGSGGSRSVLFVARRLAGRCWCQGGFFDGGVGGRGERQEDGSLHLDGGFLVGIS